MAFSVSQVASNNTNGLVKDNMVTNVEGGVVTDHSSSSTNTAPAGYRHPVRLYQPRPHIDITTATTKDLLDFYFAKYKSSLLDDLDSLRLENRVFNAFEAEFTAPNVELWADRADYVTKSVCSVKEEHIINMAHWAMAEYKPKPTSADLPSTKTRVSNLAYIYQCIKAMSENVKFRESDGGSSQQQTGTLEQLKDGLRVRTDAYIRLWNGKQRREYWSKILLTASQFMLILAINAFVLVMLKWCNNEGSMQQKPVAAVTDEKPSINWKWW